jgi:hypothetical protein
VNEETLVRMVLRVAEVLEAFKVISAVSYRSFVSSCKMLLLSLGHKQ